MCACVCVCVRVCACVRVCVCVTFILSVTVALQIQLSSKDYRAVESNGMVCINVTADRPASEPFSVFLMPMSMLHYQTASSESCI